MPSLRLTDISVRALKGTDGYRTFWDLQTPAFGVRVGKRSKTWTVMRGPKRERISFGRYPDMPLTEARREAKRLLASDPEEKPAAVTFAAARETFLTEHYRDKAARTAYLVRRSLELHFKAIEKLPLESIDDGHIRRALDKLSDRPGEQLHAFRYIRTFFHWAQRPPRRYVKHSPMDGYEAPSRDKRRSRVLSDQEIVAVWNACDCPRTAIFRIMLLWGTRNTETCIVRRAWAIEGVLTIPGCHTKNGRDHSIPLLPLAEHILAGALSTDQHHFSGRWGNGHLTPGALPKLKHDVMRRSGTNDWQLRDLRRTFRSLAARVGVRREVAELLINHAPPVLDEIYDRYDYLPEKREALAKIEHALVWLLVRA